MVARRHCKDRDTGKQERHPKRDAALIVRTSEAPTVKDRHSEHSEESQRTLILPLFLNPSSHEPPNQLRKKRSSDAQSAFSFGRAGVSALP